MGRKKPQTWEEAMKRVTTEMIRRGIRLSKRKKRTIYISKSARGEGTDIRELNPKTAVGRTNLEAFFKKVRMHYTFSNLGAPSEKNSVNWRNLNLPWRKRMKNLLLTALIMFLKGTPGKVRLIRRLGCHVGKDTEIMMGVWLDHFRPELIWIGDRTLLGAFSKLSVHAYEGIGKFRYGVIRIGSDCLLASGTTMGPINIEDNVRVLPNTTLSPYLIKIRKGSVVGYTPPPVKEAD